MVVAKSVSGSVSACDLGRAFSSGKSSGSASRDQLEEFGRYVDITVIPEAEAEALTRALLPRDPLLQERPRLVTYATLLALAEALGRVPGEEDLFEAAESVDSGLPEVIQTSLDGWLVYSVRDLIACAHEAVMQEGSLALEEWQAERDGPASSADIIRQLVSRVDDHFEALKDLRLLKGSESPLELSFRELHRRVQRATAKDRQEMGGLRRWRGGLSERAVIEAAFAAGPGALAVLPVAWLLALERSVPWQDAGESPFAALSYKGWARVGLREVIFPSVTKFLEEDWRLPDVMAELALRTVDQHLRISWTRLSQDPTRDVAVLSADGDLWYHRASFYAGRTASRLFQAVSWLSQLRLIDEDGLTRSGKEELDVALRTLGHGGVS